MGKSKHQEKIDKIMDMEDLKQVIDQIMPQNLAISKSQIMDRVSGHPRYQKHWGDMFNDAFYELTVSGVIRQRQNGYIGTKEVR